MKKLQQLLLTGLLASVIPVAAQAVDLGALGLNWNFETPNLGGNGTSETFNGSLGAGWTAVVPAGGNHESGLQGPATSYFGGQNPLPAPFEGIQIGFLNMGNLNSGGVIGQISTLESLVVGTLAAGQSYTARAAVSIRFDANFDPSSAMFELGLRTTGGTELGTFASVSVAGSENAIKELTYSLNVDTQAAGAIGQDVHLFLRLVNQNGTDLFGNGFLGQANFDNFRLDVIPEPASAGLLLVGLGALALFRRK